MAIDRVLPKASEYWIAQEGDRYLCGRKGSEEELFEVPEPESAAAGFGSRIMDVMKLQRYLDEAEHTKNGFYGRWSTWARNIDCHSAARVLFDPSFPMILREHYGLDLERIWVDALHHQLPLKNVETPFLYQVTDASVQRLREGNPVRAGHTGWCIGFDPENGQYVIAEKQGWVTPFKIVTIDTSRRPYGPCTSAFGTVEEFKGYMDSLEGNFSVRMGRKDQLSKQ
jgi:hypothetical protein